MGKSEKKSKKEHKHKRHKEHKLKHKSKKSKKQSKRAREENSTPTPPPPPTPIAEAMVGPAVAPAPLTVSEDQDFAIPIALMNSKSHAPETPEEYQRRQNQLRREVDPVTGRTRLIKGDSEILEEIVSKERHSDINKKATRGDGQHYEAQTLAAARKKKSKPK